MEGTCGSKGCDESCNRKVQNRIRHLSSDVGFYLKWEEDVNGYPRGCDAFKDLKHDWNWLYKFGKFDRKAGCPKQDMQDGYGKELWETVEMYADNQEKWIKDFVKVWDKMDKNGCENLEDGPMWKWNHL